MKKDRVPENVAFALMHEQLGKKVFINPIALRTAKTLWSFGRSECNRVKVCKCVSREITLKVGICPLSYWRMFYLDPTILC